MYFNVDGSIIMEINTSFGIARLLLITNCSPTFIFLPYLYESHTIRLKGLCCDYFGLFSREYYVHENTTSSEFQLCTWNESFNTNHTPEIRQILFSDVNVRDVPLFWPIRPFSGNHQMPKFAISMLCQGLSLENIQ